MKKLLLSLLLLIPILTYSQMDTSYNDVGVIVNSRCDSSIIVGQYYMTKHNIPANRLILVDCDSTENVDSLGFVSIKDQIEHWLDSTGIKDSLNYLVTIRGMPIRVYDVLYELDNPGLYDDAIVSGSTASLNSELEIMYHYGSAYMTKPGRLYSSFYAKHEKFTHKKYGGYIVSSLTAWSYKSVMDSIIDRSESRMVISNKSTYKGIFDSNGPRNTLGYILQFYVDAADSMQHYGYSAYYDTSEVTEIIDSTNVIAFAHLVWTSNYPNHKGVSGSFALIDYSWSGDTLNAETHNSSSPLQLTRFTQDGFTAVHGYVCEPFSSSIAQTNMFTASYFGRGFNIGTAFRSSTRYASWRNILIADPKMSIYIDPPVVAVDSVRKISKTQTKVSFTESNRSGPTWHWISYGNIDSATTYTTDTTELNSYTSILSSYKNINTIPNATYWIRVYTEYGNGDVYSDTARYSVPFETIYAKTGPLKTSYTVVDDGSTIHIDTQVDTVWAWLAPNNYALTLTPGWTELLFTDTSITSPIGSTAGNSISSNVYDTTYFYKLGGSSLPNRPFIYRFILWYNTYYTVYGGDSIYVAEAPSYGVINSYDSITASTIRIIPRYSAAESQGHYTIEYGPTTSYGDTSAEIVFTDTTRYIAVKDTLHLTDLDPATTYHMRFKSRNRYMTYNGPDTTFTTLTPTVATDSVTIDSMGIRKVVTLYTTINPKYSKAYYQFEIGLDTLYGTYSVIDSLLYNVADTSVHISVPYLIGGKTYHYRVKVAIGSKYFYGEDKTFGLGINEPIPQVRYDLKHFPNPIRTSTTIRYRIPDSLYVLLQVLTRTGEIITTLVEEWKSAGEHSVVFIPADYSLTSGLYYYKIIAGTFTKLNRMLYIK
jgi:uncharacterized protein (TIGR03790 family)